MQITNKQAQLRCAAFTILLCR